VKTQFFSLCFLALVLVTCASCEPCAGNSDEDTVLCLRGLPKEDILQDQAIKQYLSKHRVYVSLSTSPTRISKLLPVLQTVDTEYVENILLALPQRYRNKEDGQYVIPPEIANFPKLKIIRRDQDLGPIMKLIPAVEEVKASDPEAIVITIDDDTGYPAGVFGQLIKAAIKQETVSAAIARNLDISGLDRYQLMPSKTLLSKPECYSGHEISYCDLVFGYAGVAYKAKWVNTDLLTTLSTLDPSCRTSDDLVISFGLALQNIPRVSVSNQYTPLPTQFAFGFRADALQRGSGSLQVASNSDVTSLRYRTCAKIMHEWVQKNILF